MIKRIAKQLQRLPTIPGVYQFLDGKKKIIYVGKAANLKSRVRSYFRTNADLTPMKRQMVADVRDIRIIPTNSEIEALLLEANLIKKLQPHYNVTLRDDKSYLYVKISTEEEWPRVLTTRTIDRSGTYFGPFTSAHAVKEILRVLRKFLPYRCGQKVFDNPSSPPLAKGRKGGVEGEGSRRGRACFWHHLGLCPGTCVGAITNKEYKKTIRRIRLFFEGRMDALCRAMKKELGPDRVELMQNVLAHTRILSVGEQYANDTRDLARVLGVPLLHRIEGYDISNIMGREAVGSMVVFVDGEPAKSEYKKFKIKTVHGADDVAMLGEVLTRRMKHSGIASPAPRLRSGNIGTRNDVKGFWPLPDLIIVDGGKAQLNAAVRAVQGSSHCLPAGSDSSSNNIISLPVISIAKGGHGGVLKQKEEIYFLAQKTPLKLPNASSALHLVLRVRDEAHRFAIEYHRSLRSRRLRQ